MIKSLLGFVLTLSLLQAQTPRNKGYMLLSETNNVYEILFSKGTCVKSTRDETDTIRGVWKNGGIKSGDMFIPMNFALIDTERNSTGNGRHIFATNFLKKPNVRLFYMVGNKEQCNLVASHSNNEKYLIAALNYATKANKKQ